MELSKQVVSLELSKKLKELGVKQESLYWWSEHTTPAMLWNESALSDVSVKDYPGYSAFTTAELGELLPPYIDVGDESLGQVIEIRTFTSDHSKGKWDVWYEGVDANNNPCDWWYQTAETEADARAKMLIYLLSQGLLTM